MIPVNFDRKQAKIERKNKILIIDDIGLEIMLKKTRKSMAEKLLEYVKKGDLVEKKVGPKKHRYSTVENLSIDDLDKLMLNTCKELSDNNPIQVSRGWALSHTFGCIY
jgi:hypothetical protein